MTIAQILGIECGGGAAYQNRVRQNTLQAGG
jgi:hypothetical protein